ncbi:MAG: dihydroorotate dehydrogenase electron transfer subunit [Christensenellales bacterium]|jgi:dihydroorotate dehydrogenase electron transfer subunit
MSNIIFNKKLSDGFFIMKAECNDSVLPGQFYMLRAWDRYPLLSRPISVFDADGESVTFLYKTVGEGTKILSELKAGDSITLLGPLGNGFPMVKGRVALVGGGVGIAPLYMTAKALKKVGANVDIYLGFRQEAVLEKEFHEAGDALSINIGGFVTDDVSPDKYDYIFTCGPMPMMRAMYNKSKDSGAKVYISMENRMACGVGACFGCTCNTSGGNRKVCKDGPVFSGREIFEVEHN